MTGIAGIGTDIIAIGRITEALERHGERFAKRILTDAELDEFSASRTPAVLLAKRFAAKEAIAKALGTGIAHGLGFHDMHIAHDQRGRPLVGFSAAGARLCGDLGIGRCHLSLSDEREYVVAYAVAEVSADSATDTLRGS
ncbi:MAG: holo-ACP synthase [Gammaproteobacteria bacterium]